MKNPLIAILTEQARRTISDIIDAAAEDYPTRTAAEAALSTVRVINACNERDGASPSE